MKIDKGVEDRRNKTFPQMKFPKIVPKVGQLVQIFVYNHSDIVVGEDGSEIGDIIEGRVEARGTSVRYYDENPLSFKKSPEENDEEGCWIKVNGMTISFSYYDYGGWEYAAKEEAKDGFVPVYFCEIIVIE